MSLLNVIDDVRALERETCKILLVNISLSLFHFILGFELPTQRKSWCSKFGFASFGSHN